MKTWEMMKRSFLVAAIPFLVMACGHVTQENYEKLKVGMTYDEVVKVLGRPTQCSETIGIRSCHWGDDASNINANFVAGQAVLYESNNIH